MFVKRDYLIFILLVVILNCVNNQLSSSESSDPVDYAVNVDYNANTSIKEDGTIVVRLNYNNDSERINQLNIPRLGQHFNVTTCPPFPTLFTSMYQILSNWKNEGVTETGSYTDVACVCKYPIDVSFDGEHVPPLHLLETYREIMSGTDATNVSEIQTCFVIRVRTKMHKNSIGQYWCSLQYPMYRIGWINYKGQLFGQYTEALVNAEEVVYTPSLPNFSRTLPCLNERPNGEARLVKNNQTLAYKSEGFPAYDEDLGAFDLLLHERSESERYGKYGCSVNMSDETYTDNSLYTYEQELNFANVLATPEFEVEPKRQEIELGRDESILLKCTSKFPVDFRAAVVDKNVTLGELRTKYNDLDPMQSWCGFKYEIELHLSGEKYLDIIKQIHCVNRATGEPYYSWNTHDANDDGNLVRGIRYNSTEGYFFCASEAMCGDHHNFRCPTITILKCKNPIECQLLEACFDKKGEFRDSEGTCMDAKISDRAKVCKHKLPLRFLGLSCMYVDTEVYSSGLVHCTKFALSGNSMETSQSMYFFKGIHVGERKAGLVTNWKTDPKEHYIQITLPITETNSTSFFDNQLVKISCTYSSFLFVYPAQFRVQTKNGTIMLPKKGSPDEIVTSGDGSCYTSSSSVYLDSTEIQTIICFVPFWNSTEWLNTSLDIEVKAQILPMIIEPTLAWVYKSYEVGTTQILRCQVHGGPIPHIKWIYKGGIEVNNISIREVLMPNSSSRLSELEFARIIQEDSGQYECRVVDHYGHLIGSRTFEITVYSPAEIWKIVLGVSSTLMLMLFFSIVAFLTRKLQRKQELIRRFNEGNKEALLEAPESLDGIIEAQCQPFNKKYEIKQEDLFVDINAVLGQGNYGIVYKGKYSPPAAGKNELSKEIVVAVKMSKVHGENELENLMVEFQIMQFIGQHENIIQLIGLETTNIQKYDIKVVTEFCSFGSLDQYLQSRAQVFLNQIVNDQIIPVSRMQSQEQSSNSRYTSNLQTHYAVNTTDLVRWSHQIICGLKHLESVKIVHCDISASNVLLNENKVAKISDFGLAEKLRADGLVILQQKDFAWKWASPETHKYCRFSSSSDIWSFGTTLWEIFSLGQEPYPHHTSASNTTNAGPQTNNTQLKHVIPLTNLGKPAYATSAVYEVLRSCMKINPAERISLNELESFFQNLLKQLE